MTRRPDLQLVPMEPDEDVVGLLESVLEAAKAGIVRSVAIVIVERGGMVSTGWSTEQDPISYHILNSGAAVLSNRLASANLGEEHEQADPPWGA